MIEKKKLFKLSNLVISISSSFISFYHFYYKNLIFLNWIYFLSIFLISKKNFSVREGIKPGIATNPSKRHRERLNSELEIVAALLPYEQNVISRF